MTPLVHLRVVRDLLLAIGFGGNDRLRAALVEVQSQGIVVEGLVSEQSTEVEVLQDRLGANAVVALAGQQGKADQVSQRIDHGQDLGGQPTSGTADGLILSPPFAPVPCWWTRTIVPSMITYSKSGSPDRLLKTRSNTPLSVHRRKRRQTEFQLPKGSGRSRHGAPVRAIHNTASRKRRLSLAVVPGSVALPGSKEAIRFHCLWVKTMRIKAELPFFSLESKSCRLGNPQPLRSSKTNVHRPYHYSCILDLICARRASA